MKKILRVRLRALCRVAERISILVDVSDGSAVLIEVPHHLTARARRKVCRRWADISDNRGELTFLRAREVASLVEVTADLLGRDILGRRSHA